MTSPLNKTLTVNKGDRFPILKYKDGDRLENKIYSGNCVTEMKKLPTASVDLIVTDPPYTIKRDFGKGTVDTKEKEFTAWCEEWIYECER